MPTKIETRDKIAELLTRILAELGGTPGRAWLAIYQALLWFEPNGYLHIIDADKLRNRPSGVLNAWQKRALAVQNFIESHLNCSSAELPSKLDQLMRNPEYHGLQRQNPLGIAFIASVKFLLAKYGDPGMTLRDEVPATDLFPGIQLPGRSVAPSVDLAAFKGERLVAIISTKWSIRHDRIGDLVSECRAYKAASYWSRPFKYLVATNEFDPARLSKVIEDTCFDGVFHVHKPAVAEVSDLNGRLESLLDLSDLFQSSSSW